MRFYHGTDHASAVALGAGEPLDAAKAAAFKIDGPPGFFLATELPDAQFFALRQGRGAAAVIGFEVFPAAEEALLSGGAVRRPIPRGPSSPRFLGEELAIPPELFGTFDALRRAGEIEVAAVEE
jgi:hypothetical protein